MSHLQWNPCAICIGRFIYRVNNAGCILVWGLGPAQKLLAAKLAAQHMLAALMPGTDMMQGYSLAGCKLRRMFHRGFNRMQGPF